MHGTQFKFLASWLSVVLSFFLCNKMFGATHRRNEKLCRFARMLIGFLSGVYRNGATVLFLHMSCQYRRRSSCHCCCISWPEPCFEERVRFSLLVAVVAEEAVFDCMP